MSLKDIASFFQSEWIKTDIHRCLNPRHKLACCHVCAKACPQDAITINDTGVEIEAMLCNNCGICVSDCPTGVFQHDYFDAFKLIEWAKYESDIHIGCQAVTTNHAHMAKIPCHGMLTESLLAALYGNGVAHIHLHGLDGCASCPTRVGKNRIDAVQQHPLRTIPTISMHDKYNIADGATVVIKHAQTTDMTKEPIMARRTFLTNLGQKSAASLLPAAVKRLLEDNTGQSGMNDIGDDEDMLMHKHIPAYHRLSIMALFSGRQMHATQSFRRIEADDHCTGCQICAVRCPTGALIWNEGDEEHEEKEGGNVSLSFRSLACIACGLCISICPYDALSMQAQQDSKALRIDERKVLFRSHKHRCMACHAPFLSDDSENHYCSQCQNEMNMHPQWSGSRMIGPRNR